MRTPTPSPAPSIQRRARCRKPRIASRGCATPHRSVEELRRQIDRYARSYRLTLEVLAAEHSAYEDLLFSYPAAAVSLAGRRGPPAERGEALNLIRRGASLVEVAAALQLPHWLRKLPPEAFPEPPPYPFPGPCGAEDGADSAQAEGEFGRRVVNLAPQEEWSGWLRWVAAGRRAGGDDFALWLMSQRLHWARATPERILAPIAAYAWFSGRDHLRAGALLPREWTPEFALTAAVRNARRWLLRLLFEISAPPEESPWAQSRKARSYKIEPIIGVDSFVEEGISMKNCLASYAEAVAEGRCRIYALRRGGKSVANLEIRPPSEHGGPPSIHQLLGRRNRKASAAAQTAVRFWRDGVMAEIAESPSLSARAAEPFAPPDLALWREMFEPYAAARPEAELLIAPLLEDPRWSLDALNRLCRLMRARPPFPE